MKKSVVLTIGVIYVLAIIVVGFIGVKAHVYDPEIYVTKITCISPNYIHEPNSEEGYDGYISTIYTENLRVLIKCEITPDNATNKTLKYIYQEKPDSYEFIKNSDGTATVIFKKPGSLSITIRADDNKGATTTIRVFAIEL